MASPVPTGHRGLLIAESREQAGISQRRLTKAWCAKFNIEWSERQINRLRDLEHDRRYVSLERTADWLQLIEELAAQGADEAPSPAKGNGGANVARTSRTVAPRAGEGSRHA